MRKAQNSYKAWERDESRAEDPLPLQGMKGDVQRPRDTKENRRRSDRRLETWDTVVKPLGWELCELHEWPCGGLKRRWGGMFAHAHPQVRVKSRWHRSQSGQGRAV